MIKFFRKIRFNLMSENKTGKYLKYAIGEIILVVIGILIALQINNWNEGNIQKSEMRSIYLSIVDELENDSRILNKILPNFESHINVLKRILTEEISNDEWNKNSSLFSSFSWFNNFNISQERFELLKTKTDYNAQTRKLNIQISDFYKKHSTEIKIVTDETNMSYHRNMKFWEENEEWFSLAIVNRDFSKLGEYAKNNPIFKNKIAWYKTMLSNLKGSLENYKNESQILSDEIKQYLDASK